MVSSTPEACGAAVAVRSLVFPSHHRHQCTPAVQMPPGLSASPGRVPEFVIEACTVVAVGMVTAAAAALFKKR